MKVLIFSHKDDIDGITPVVLAKLCYDNVDTILTNAQSVNDELENLIATKKLFKYDQIYFTDLCPRQELCEYLNNSSVHNKVLVFDHHLSSNYVNNYDFGLSIEVDSNGHKPCGTSLFYKHLCSQFINIMNEGVANFVELVRLQDTWDWAITNNLDSLNLNRLFTIYGRDEFINNYVTYFKKNKVFKFTENEKFLLKIENSKVERYILEKSNQILIKNIDGKKVIISFAENHRSELGNHLLKKHPEIDYVILIDINKGLSFRGNDKIDLSKIASLYNGGGHFNAAGAPISKSKLSEIISIILEK